MRSRGGSGRTIRGKNDPETARQIFNFKQQLRRRKLPCWAGAPATRISIQARPERQSERRETQTAVRCGGAKEPAGTSPSEKGEGAAGINRKSRYPRGGRNRTAGQSVRERGSICAAGSHCAGGKAWRQPGSRPRGRNSTGACQRI